MGLNEACCELSVEMMYQSGVISVEVEGDHIVAKVRRKNDECRVPDRFEGYRVEKVVNR